MKKYLLLLIGFCFLVSCQKEVVEKPDNLIERDKMDDIIYDLALLQAMRSNFQSRLDSNKINSANYIYKKYKIDSAQFANSNRYYASDVAAYNRMYNRVDKRLAENKAKTDSLVKKAAEKSNREKEAKNLKKLDSVK